MNGVRKQPSYGTGSTSFEPDEVASTIGSSDIERALQRKAAFDKHPGRHTFEMELGNDG